MFCYQHRLFFFGHTGRNESGKPPRLACLGTKALILGEPGTSPHSVVMPDTPFDAAYIDTKRTHGRLVEYSDNPEKKAFATIKPLSKSPEPRLYNISETAHAVLAVVWDDNKQPTYSFYLVTFQGYTGRII